MSGCLESKAISKLPKEAKEVNEYYDASWNGDYVRLIKAKIQHDKLKEYAHAIGLINHFPTNEIKNETRNELLSNFSEAPEWWTPPNKKDIEEFYYLNPDIDDYQTAFWHEGYLYYINYVW